MAAAVVGLCASSIPALAEPVLRVISTREVERLDVVIRMFQGLHGVRVEVVHEPDLTTERLLSHQAQLPFDVLLSNDITVLEGARRAGLTTALAAPQTLDRIPASYRAEDGHWVGVTLRTRAIVASRKRVTEAALDYADLAKPEWKGRVCMSPGGHRYNVGLVAAMLAAQGKVATRAWLDGVKANLARPAIGTDRDQIRAVAAGLCDVAIVNTYDLYALPTSQTTDEEVRWQREVTAILPVAPLQGTHAGLFGAAPLGGGHASLLAARFVAFLADDAQYTLSTVYGEYPVDPNAVAAQSLPAGFKTDPTPYLHIWSYFDAARSLIAASEFEVAPQN
jgi:iron(III) transport system substrate-binding protein